MQYILIVLFTATGFYASAQKFPKKQASLSHTLQMQQLLNSADPTRINTTETENGVPLIRPAEIKTMGRMPVLKLEAKPEMIAEQPNGSYVYRLPLDAMRGITGDIRSVPNMPGVRN